MKRTVGLIVTALFLSAAPLVAAKDYQVTGPVVDVKDDAIIVKAIINLAHSLQLRVIAEGAENLDQVQFLWQNHCDQVQGYYFCPAVSLEHLTTMLEERVFASM